MEDRYKGVSMDFNRSFAMNQDDCTTVKLQISMFKVWASTNNNSLLWSKTNPHEKVRTNKTTLC